MVSEARTDSLEPQAKKLKNDNEAEVAAEEVKETKNPGETPPTPLSKNQIKKQQKLANYERIKKERRLRERERQRQKRQEAIAQGLPTRSGPSRKELKKKQTDTTGSILRAVIDLDYDDLMHERDVAKCVKQCLRIYTINRRAEHPGQLYFTGIKPEGRIHAAFKKNDGYENWHVRYHFGQTYSDVFDKEEIVYLTSESDEVLDCLAADKVYIIGGLVDHNHQKGLCHERATKLGLRTARLPLNEHVDMKTRTVLTTFHVFEILMRRSEGKTWTDAILETIPQRKGAKAKPLQNNGKDNKTTLENEKTEVVHETSVADKTMNEKDRAADIQTTVDHDAALALTNDATAPTESTTPCNETELLTVTTNKLNTNAS